MYRIDFYRQNYGKQSFPNAQACMLSRKSRFSEAEAIAKQQQAATELLKLV